MEVYGNEKAIFPKADRDLLLIGGLLLLLLRDKGDRRLILALAYILAEGG